MTGRQIAELTRAGALRSAQQAPFKCWRRDIKRLFTREMAIQAALFSIVALTTAFLGLPAPTGYQIGQVAENTIRADRGFKFFDQAATERQKREAEEKTPPVFILDDIQPLFLAKKASALFQRGRNILALNEELPPASSLASLRHDFQELFRFNDDYEVWDAVLKRRFDPALERRTAELAMEIMAQGLPEADFQATAAEARAGTIIILSNRSEYAAPRLDALMDGRRLERLLEGQARKLALEYDEEEVGLILALAQGLLRPNLRPDSRETQERLWRAAAEIKDVYANVRPGQIIVQEGTVIEAEAQAKLQALRAGDSGETDRLGRFLGLALTLFIFFNVSLFLSSLGAKKSFNPPPVRDQAFMAAVLLLTAITTHNASVFGASLSWDFNYVDNNTIFYAAPFPAAAMLAGIFFGVRESVLMAILVAVTAAAVMPGEGRLLNTLYIYNGSIVAAFCLRRMKERKNLVPAAFWTMAVNCLTILSLTLSSETGWGRQTANNFLSAAACGLFSGILASGLMPLLEMIFGFSTNLRLLELGNLDRPLLREMMLSAPGTYHHSVIVGAMVEAAAEAIGANPHLAKVGAYYHDIGKMKKPLYFVENQAGDNRHDTLAPSMSALVLIGHVRDGAEIARAQRLPRSIIDIIEQHHGVSLMGFFYHKAKEQHKAGQQEINEGDFRYPGPKPRSVESGLVMLGDMCEAATRSLAEPSPTKINNLIRLLVNQIFSDGQLDECDLKTSEISAIINIFTTILVGIYHRRVAYPGARKTAEEPDKKSAPETAALPESGQAEPFHARLSVEPPKSPAH